VTKLNSTIYNKLFAQAEEAKEQGLVKLADHIMDAIEKQPEVEVPEYSYSELEANANSDLWKIAANVMKYYDIQSADVEKVQVVLLHTFSKLASELEVVLDVEGVVIGPLEPKTFGQK